MDVKVPVKKQRQNKKKSNLQKEEVSIVTEEIANVIHLEAS